MAKAVTFFVGSGRCGDLNPDSFSFNVLPMHILPTFTPSKHLPLYEKNTDPNGCTHHRFLQ